MNSRLISLTVSLLLPIAAACADDADPMGDSTETTGEGDGDGDPSGDGDGDPATGDGDGDATGDGDGDEPTTTGDGDGDPGDTPCSAMVEGLNSNFVINGTPRSFYVDLPSDADQGGPWPIVFNWHGLGDTADNFRQLVASFVDGPEFPFIGITPEDTDFNVMVPFVGAVPLDWDVFDTSEGSIEVELFDRVLSCADQQWGVDANHVHTMGFSLGAITSDLLATVRGETLASVGTWSGGYWSNPQNIDPLLGMIVNWPVYLVDNPYPQLMFHGGETDTFDVVPMVYALSFVQFATNDEPFLSERGHDLIICDHGDGHTVPANSGPQLMFEFFADHPLGVGETWVDQGEMGSLPDFCVATPAQ